MKSLVLLSGGLDSTTALAVCKEDDKRNPVLALSILYGQRHMRELQAARAVADHYGIKHQILGIPQIGEMLSNASALLNPTEALPQDRSIERMTKDIPRSYVPGRNTMMLAIAQSIAEGLDMDYIYVGFNHLDYSGYPDCRPEYVQQWNNLAKLATKRGVEGHPILVEAPIINSTKVEIIEIGRDLHAPLELTWSCYKGEETPCLRCDSCIIRQAAFNELGMTDPALKEQHAV